MKNPYLNQANVVKRLLSEWDTHGKLIIAYDFDNTVFDYHSQGHTYDEIISLLQRCKRIGAYMILFTAANDVRLPFIKEYLGRLGIPCDAINENMPGMETTGRKIYYNILLDDRAGLFSAYQALHIACLHMEHQKENDNDK